MSRASVIANEELGIVGIGDSTKRQDAERLAALSALLQMQAAGLVSGKCLKKLISSLGSTANRSFQHPPGAI